MLEVVDTSDENGCVTGGEAHARQTMLTVSRRPDLSRCRTADKRKAHKESIELIGQYRKIIGAGAEEDHEGGVVLGHRGVELPGGLSCVSCA